MEVAATMGRCAKYTEGDCSTRVVTILRLQRWQMIVRGLLVRDSRVQLWATGKEH